MIVITHEMSFACEAADRLLLILKIMTTRLTGGLYKGYKPMLPASV